MTGSSDGKEGVPDGISDFGFVGSADLRTSLQGDYVELEKALQAGLWKSACVLAGSIAEATLLDYINVLGHCSATQEDLAREMLPGLINVAVGIDVLAALEPQAAAWSLKDLAQAGRDALRSDSDRSLRTVYLMSSAVKDFRNLIHPGRELRLREKADRNIAMAARAFVDRLVLELGTESRRRFPYSSEDVINKVQCDEGARTVLQDILRKTRPSEISRLLVDLAPKAYLSYLSLLSNADGPTQDQDDYDFFNKTPDSVEVADAKSMCRRVTQAYCLAFDSASTNQKRAALHAVASLLVKQSSSEVSNVELHLLRISSLQYASAEDQLLIAGDVLDRIQAYPSGKRFIESAEGIAAFLNPVQSAGLAETLLGTGWPLRGPESTRKEAEDFLKREYSVMSADCARSVYSVADRLRRTLSTVKGSEDRAKRIQELLDYWDQGASAPSLPEQG
jgi:hypothetical protein